MRILLTFALYCLALTTFGQSLPGCTDPNACNFNPDATCDAGACNYYCGGCTNPDAINYNANALWEDGSCFFSIEPPQMQLVVEDVEAQDFYFVRMDVMEIGNGAPYVVSSDYNTEMMMISIMVNTLLVHSSVVLQ